MAGESASETCPEDSEEFTSEVISHPELAAEAIVENCLFCWDEPKPAEFRIALYSDDSALVGAFKVYFDWSPSFTAYEETDE